MPTAVQCLEKLPTEFEFYKNYWNKKPFVVKNGAPSSVMSDLIKPEELLWLSLDEDARSRIVKRSRTQSDWIVDHGPFAEGLFETLGEENWSLLVQEVDSFHPPTKKLIEPFNFSPCWLMEDVMVSYSTPGGGIGPHLDSYHVFLVQGAGKRRWKIGREAIANKTLIENIELEILKDDFDGDTFEVESGDVIYVPPKFAHSGETLEASMTYSIGFVGPQLSDLFFEFGHYIEERDQLNTRYFGNDLDESSSGYQISSNEVDNFRDTFKKTLNSDHFDKWLKSYFKGLND